MATEYFTCSCRTLPLPHQAVDSISPPLKLDRAVAALTRRMWQNWETLRLGHSTFHDFHLAPRNLWTFLLDPSHNAVKKSRPHGETYYRSWDWQHQLKSQPVSATRLVWSKPLDALFSSLWVFQLRPQTSQINGKPSLWGPDWMSYNQICEHDKWLLKSKYHNHDTWKS